MRIMIITIEAVLSDCNWTRTHNHQMVECSFTNEVVVGSSPLQSLKTSDFAPVSSKEFLDIQATIECGFTLKRVRYIIYC